MGVAMNFGRIIKKTEEGGAVIEKSTTYSERKPINERWRYEERFRVKSDEEAMTKIIELTDKIAKTPTAYIDPEIKYIGRTLLPTRGRFDIIFCYTKIVFDDRL